jgi:hypothetical protein
MKVLEKFHVYKETHKSNESNAKSALGYSTNF